MRPDASKTVVPVRYGGTICPGEDLLVVFNFQILDSRIAASRDGLLQAFSGRQEEIDVSLLLIRELGGELGCCGEAGAWRVSVLTFEISCQPLC